MKARSKKVGIIGIVIAAVLIAAILVVDILCAQYSALITLYFRGDAKTADAQTALEESNEFTVKQEESGLVLMKNENNVLPLAAAANKVNLFGALSAKQIYMGTGSAGGFNWAPEDFVNLKDALAEQGVAVNDNLWNFYSALTGNASGTAGSVTDMQGSTHSIVDVPLDFTGYEAARTAAESYSDTAIVVVGRAGGEGSDAVMEMNPYSASGRGGVTNYNVGGNAGKHYLELMDAELALVDYVKANYKNVILLVNTPMPIELGFADAGTQNADGKGNIDSVVWIGLPGTTGNRGVARMLTGKVSPSGRLPDTWAYEMESAPSYYNFGDYKYDFGDTAVPDSYKAVNYIHYQESIYVGYRWYETANAENVSVSGVGNFQYDNTTYENDNRKFGRDGSGNVIGAERKDFDFGDYDSIVQYPFGTGLTYADFDIAFDGAPAYDAATNEFAFNVKVTNTHAAATAKTPVEIYVEQPWDASEGIEKSKVVLAGFAKTSDIAPGESVTLPIRINRDELASYDYKTEKAYVLSAGDYKFYADWGKYGAHCWANTDDADVLTWTYNLAAKKVFKGSDKRDGDVTAATNKFDDVNVGDGAYKPADNDMKRGSLADTFPKSYAAGLAMDEIDAATKMRMLDKTSGAVLEGYDAASFRYTGAFADADGAYKDPATGYSPLALGESGGLTVADLVDVAYDDERWDTLIAQMTFGDLERLIGYCGWSNPAVRAIGKNFAVDMDGAHGLHNLVSGIDANCFTTTPITAASFDSAIAYEFGQKYSAECLANGVSGMYGFSMNMHRSPFGGRAFEYYSEDGLLAGMIAAAATGGMQDNGVVVYSKHYAVNDQETNRSTSHTWASEQAIREIYLRPFELVTKLSTNKSDLLHGNTGFMTGMNYVGTAHTTSHYPLITAVPRGEWGFEGRIVTDAESYNGTMSCAIRAGTDMILTPDARKFDTVAGMNNAGGYGLTKIQEAAKHQLFVFVNSSGITATGGSMAWVALPIVISIVLAAGAILIAIFMIVPAFFIKKKKA